MGSESVKFSPCDTNNAESTGTGFHCSGFVRYVLKEAGLAIPDYIGIDNVRRPTRYANELWDHYGINVSDGAHRGGDLIFFSKNGMVPTHVGIVRDSETYIHAPGKEHSVVTVSAISRTAIKNALGIGSIYFENPIGYKSPVVPFTSNSKRYHQQIAD